MSSGTGVEGRAVVSPHRSRRNRCASGCQHAPNQLAALVYFYLFLDACCKAFLFLTLPLVDRGVRGKRCYRLCLPPKPPVLDLTKSDSGLISARIANAVPSTMQTRNNKSPVGDMSVVTLIRTATTLDHSQKAEKE